VFSNFIQPDFCIDISSVMDQKTRMLAFHVSQKTWLDKSQKMDAYLHTMQAYAKEVGQLTPSFPFAEGWRKRLHLGYCDEAFAPLEEALHAYIHVYNKT
jgi:LmbE family N-acetylglucosaminyl deacetylase